MAIGNLESLREIILAAGSSFSGCAEEFDWYMCSDVPTWEAKTALVGSGHCVPLVQQATGAPQANQWVKGPTVRGNSKIPFGAVIATFDDQGRYANKSTGNHAAILLEHKPEGLVVLDQWKGKSPARPSRRTIKFKGGIGAPSNDGDAYQLVLTRKLINSALKSMPGYLQGYAQRARGAAWS